MTQITLLQLTNHQTLTRRQQKENLTLNITPRWNKLGLSAPDDTELTVQTSRTPSYTKKNFCLYCKKFQSKLARHLELVHKDENDVQKFVNLPPKNRERVLIIATIRKNGNHVYNTDRRFNRGELLVVRRPHQKNGKEAKDFLPCGNCKGQYARSVIRHHWRKCTKGLFKGKGKERLVMIKGRTIAAKIHEKANAIVRKYIFPYLREDVIVRGIRYDELIIIYANKQCEKYGTHTHHYRMIRARLRLLGRFLNAIKSINPAIKKFSDVFQPRYYDDTIRAVKIVTGFDENLRTFAHPAVASNLGTLIKHVGELLRFEYIKNQEPAYQKQVEDFLTLQSVDYGTSVNRAVAETQIQNKNRKKVILPSMKDITMLNNFLKFEREKYFKRLKREFVIEDWLKLAGATLISLQLFNRLRAGEIERVHVQDFDSYHRIDKVADEDTYKILSKEGQALANKYVRFLIRGKRIRPVPVLVPADILECLLLIKKHRRDAEVPEENPFLFGLASDDDIPKYLSACKLLREFSVECGASMPDALRGTQLRKHIATK